VLLCVRLRYVGLDSFVVGFRLVFLRWGALICFKVHLARGSGSNVGPLFKLLYARVSDPYNWSLFSKYTTRILMVQT